MLRAKKHRSINSPQFNHEIRYQNCISPNSFSISCFHLMWGGVAEGVKTTITSL